MFIDDIFVIWIGWRESLRFWQRWISRIPYSVCIDEGGNSYTPLYTRSTDSHSYLPYSFVTYCQVHLQLDRGHCQKCRNPIKLFPQKRRSNWAIPNSQIENSWARINWSTPKNHANQPRLTIFNIITIFQPIFHCLKSIITKNRSFLTRSI